MTSRRDADSQEDDKTAAGSEGRTTWWNTFNSREHSAIRSNLDSKLSILCTCFSTEGRASCTDTSVDRFRFEQERSSSSHKTLKNMRHDQLWSKSAPTVYILSFQRIRMLFSTDRWKINIRNMVFHPLHQRFHDNLTKHYKGLSEIKLP